MGDLTSAIFRIQRYSIHDGPGIRTTLFFQGCPLACAWCHNPESQARPEPLEAIDPLTPDSPLVRDLMAQVEKDLIFYDDSGGGVTFSGGEPLGQPELVMALAGACREREIHTCLDTSGAAPWPVLEGVARAVDLILYDIKAVDPGLHRRLTGVSPAMILDNLEKLSREGLPVLLRFPLIPGCTDGEENLAAVAEFLHARTAFRTLHILPFHPTAAGKYQALNRPDPMAGVDPPSPEQVAAVARRFHTLGFDTHIGG